MDRGHLERAANFPMILTNRLRPLFCVTAALALLLGCGDDPGGGSAAGAAGEAGAGAGAGFGGMGASGEGAQAGRDEGGAAGAAAAAGAGGATRDCIDPAAPFEWPVPLEEVSVPPHDSWKT